MVASTMLTTFSATANARWLPPAFPRKSTPTPTPNLGGSVPSPGQPMRGPEVSVDITQFCVAAPWWPPCSWWTTDPKANLTQVAFENRMQDEMVFQCDGDFLHFNVQPGETVHRFYDVQLLKVSCAWGYAGNYMSGVTVWDERWPEATLCRDHPAGANGECIRLVFDNKEVFLVTRARRRPSEGMRRNHMVRTVAAMDSTLHLP
ncbi:hypothetical protein ABZP36_008273 [Zizania latifolia]